MMTFTVAVALALPAEPLAVSRYVVVALGNTWRLPFDCTVPNPGSIVTVVASETDHRKVADCPRSIDDGSAVNCAITGGRAPSGGAVGAEDTGGGGAVVTVGACFL